MQKIEKFLVREELVFCRCSGEKLQVAVMPRMVLGINYVGRQIRLHGAQA